MDLSALMASSGGGGDGDGGGGGGGGGEGTITEEQMQAAIAEAVEKVKEASAAEKKAAVEAAKEEMMARHEGLMRGMMARGDMEATLRDAVMHMDGTDAEKKAALDKALSALDKKYDSRKSGGKVRRRPCHSRVRPCGRRCLTPLPPRRLGVKTGPTAWRRRPAPFPRSSRDPPSRLSGDCRHAVG